LGWWVPTLLSLMLAQAAAPLPPAPTPAYVQRGDAVESRYRAFRERLERDFQVMSPRAEAEARDLHPKLRAATAEPIPYGYEILPKVIADLPSSLRPRRSTSTPFSWPRTEALIHASLQKLDVLEAEL